MSSRDGNDAMDANGANVTRVTIIPANDWLPSWAADETEILFASNRGGRELDVYATSLDGTSLRRLTTAPGYDAPRLAALIPPTLVFCRRAPPGGPDTANPGFCRRAPPGGPDTANPYPWRAAMYSSISRSRRSSGNSPCPSTTLWNSARLNAVPSAVFARSRSSIIFSMPIL